MIPAKLLGLRQTQDSIIVRGDGAASLRRLPQPMTRSWATIDDADPHGPKVLRRLIALRKRGGQE